MGTRTRRSPEGDGSTPSPSTQVANPPRAATTATSTSNQEIAQEPNELTKQIHDAEHLRPLCEHFAEHCFCLKIGKPKNHGDNEKKPTHRRPHRPSPHSHPRGPRAAVRIAHWRAGAHRRPRLPFSSGLALRESRRWGVLRWRSGEMRRRDALIDVSDGERG